MNYILFLYVTVFSTVNGTIVSKPGVQSIAKFETMQECYNYAGTMKLDVESYYCKRVNL